jgi:hypothetical protein
MPGHSSGIYNPLPTPSATVPNRIVEVETSTPPQSTQTAAPTETAQPEPDPTQYYILAELDDSQKLIHVVQTILYTNATGQELEEIIVAVEPNRFHNSFSLDSLIRVGSEQTLVTNLERNWLRIQLPEPLPQGAQIELQARYRLQLPRIPPPSDYVEPQIYGFTNRQINLVDWYMWIPPYDPQKGWVAHPPSFFGEYYVYPAADFRVEFKIKNANRPLVVAASTLPIMEGDNHWIYEHSSGRNFVLSISPDYEIQEAVVGGFVIRSYSFPLYSRHSGTVLSHTVKAFQLYADLFGKLPRASLSVVQADFLDGMEFDGLHYLSKAFYDTYDGTPQGYLTMIAVHETAHQWWYTLVANDQALHPWLDEAICTYSELLYYENVYPELVDWWWNARVTFFQPEGVIDLPVYDYPGYIAYRNAVYLRGALFFRDLRELLGDDLFFAGLRRIVDQKSFEIIRPEDFFRLMAVDGSHNIQPLLDEYFSPKQ